MGHVESVLVVLPWAPLVIVLSVILAVMLSSRLAEPLGMAAGWVATLIVAVGLIVAMTLTPVSDPVGSGELARVWLGVPQEPILPSTWWPLDDRALNVLLYVPLGLAIAQIGRGRWLARIVVAALLAPLVVESVQRLIPVMHRGPQWIDVADNLIGLAVGLVFGFAIRGVFTSRRG